MLYDLFDTRTGKKVGQLSEAGLVDCTDPQARNVLAKLLSRALLTRQGPPGAEDFGEVVEEGELCYLDQRSVAPGDPDYLAVLVRQLPILTYYEARLSE